MSGGRSAGGVRRRRVLASLALAVLAASCSSGSHIELSPTTTATSVTPSNAPTSTDAPRHFGTLPVGAPLPSDEACAALVRPATEVRPGNTSFNQAKGHGPPANPPAPLYARVTGNFTGTTDEIIQWAACKWGIDEDIVRAQAAKESYWTQTNVGDNGESFGLLQVREPFWGWAFNNGVGDAKSSSAYNLDAALAARRNCFEGNETWLNTTADRGRDYAAGDIWGCIGLWFSGRWYTPDSNDYISAVRDYLKQKIWLTPGFPNYAGG